MGIVHRLDIQLDLRCTGYEKSALPPICQSAKMPDAYTVSEALVRSNHILAACQISSVAFSSLLLRPFRLVEYA